MFDAEDLCECVCVCVHLCVLLYLWGPNAGSHFVGSNGFVGSKSTGPHKYRVKEGYDWGFCRDEGHSKGLAIAMHYVNDGSSQMQYDKVVCV